MDSVNIINSPQVWRCLLSRKKDTFDWNETFPDPFFSPDDWQPEINSKEEIDVERAIAAANVDPATQLF